MSVRRNFNPSVRTLLKKNLDIPVYEPLSECSWPQREEDCKLSIGKKLISSSGKRQTNKYEVRSISNTPEPDECAIGPEFHGLFDNDKDTRTLLEAIIDSEIKIGNIKQSQREETLRDISQVISNDISRRKYLLLAYVVYFIIAGFILNFNYQNFVNVDPGMIFNNRMTLLILYLLPMITVFFLHIKFGERVRSESWFHVIPLVLLIIYGLQARIYQDGVLTPGHRLVQIVMSLVAIGISIYLLMRFRTIFETCSKYQLNRRLSGNGYVIFGFLGLVVPLLLLNGMYVTSINTSNNP